MNLSAIDELQPYAVELAQNLIRVPTENPPGNLYHQCAHFLHHQCQALGMESDLIQVEQTDRFIVVARTDTGKSDLHFHCHYDVVPAGAGWTINPFGGERKRGRIYGRGSSDMKGAIASVFTALRAAGDQLNKSVSISLTPDEETGGELGAQYLTKKNLIHTKMAILPEPTGLKTIYNGCKGALQMEVTVCGKAGHSSIKGYGVNAFEKMVHIAKDLLVLKEEIESKKSTLPSYPPGGEWANLTLGGRCSTGEAVNAVPGKAIFTIDRRTLPEEDMEEARKEILTHTGDATCRVLLQAYPFHIKKSEKVCQWLLAAAQKVMDSPVDFALCPGFLDARYFVQAKTPCISWGPGIYEKAHTADEYIRIADMMTAAKVFYTMLTAD